MQRRARRWVYPEHDPKLIRSLFPRFTEVEGQILTGLGFKSQSAAISFLNDEAIIDPDPFLLTGMASAVSRVQQAIREAEPITIYADYDADGVTSAALLYSGLQVLGAVVKVYFPDRFTEGYGINNGAIERLARERCSLLISVDCGIRAVEEAQTARKLGVDLIITDHHHPPSELPNAVAILNPNLEGDPYPQKELAGVGVAYKLLQALTGEAGVNQAEEVLDLVAIGTIADMSKLIGENRATVQRGLERLNTQPRPGLRSLMGIAGYQLGRIDANAIGFGLGPRINAAGRLKRANLAFDLLMAPSEDNANELAKELDDINKRRQELTLQVVEAAEQSIGEGDRPVVFAFDPIFHEGVVGLAASRLSEVYYRPAFVGTVGEENTRISARSIPGFHLTQALEICSDLLLRFGGHAAAAGLSLENRLIEDFTKRFEEIARAQLDEERMTPKLNVSAEVNVSDLNPRLLKFHDRLEPMGEGNEWPILAARNVEIVNRRRVGAEGRHLKLKVRGDALVIDAIAFRMGERMQELPDRIDLAFRLERNEYMGQISPQMNVVDIRPANAS